MDHCKSSAVLPWPLAAVALAATLLSGCLTGGDGNGNPQTPSGDLLYNTPYLVEDSVIKVPPFADTSYACHGDSLVPRIDSITGIAIRFHIDGNALTLINSTDTLLSGSVVETILIFKRIDGQGALEGSWRYADQDQRVASGIPTAVEANELRDDLVRARFRNSFNEIVYVFDRGMLRVYRDEKTAERRMTGWYGTDLVSQEPADSMTYDMDARIVDKYTVEYRGRKTLETVRLTEMPNGDLDVMSFDSQHPPAHIRNNPIKCPEEVVPAWYYDFRTQNRKTPGP